MPLPPYKEIENLRNIEHWTANDLQYLLLAKQIRRAENNRPFCAYVLKHEQNKPYGKQNPDDSFHQFLEFVKKNIDSFENESCMQMLVHDGRTPGHWTNFSLMIKDSKIHVFACDSADDTPGELSLIELQKVLGDKIGSYRYYKLQPDIIPEAEKGSLNDPRRIIQAGNFECSRMALYNAEILSKAGSQLFQKLKENELIERYRTLLQANSEVIFNPNEDPQLEQIKLITPQVAVRILPALYGVTQSSTRLKGLLDIAPKQEIGNSGRTLREWVELHSEEHDVNGQLKKTNRAIMHKSDKMVDHLLEVTDDWAEPSIEKLAEFMQDWTKSAPLKGNKPLYQPPEHIMKGRTLEKENADKAKHLQIVYEKVNALLKEKISTCLKQISELEEQQEQSFLSKIKCCCWTETEITEKIEDLNNQIAKCRLLESNLDQLKMNLEQLALKGLEQDLLMALRVDKLPEHINLALERAMPKSLKVQQDMKMVLKKLPLSATNATNEIEPPTI